MQSKDCTGQNTSSQLFWWQIMVFRKIGSSLHFGRVELSHEISPILCYIPASAELTQIVLALLVSAPSSPFWGLPQRKQLSQKCWKGRRSQKSSTKSHPGETPAILTDDRADKAWCTCPPVWQHQAWHYAQHVAQWMPRFSAPQAFTNRVQVQQHSNCWTFGASWC